MSKIWCFGDSYSEKYNTEQDWSKNYINYKKYVPKVFSEFLSEMLNVDFYNLSCSGYDNYSIFQSICDNVNQIKKNDIIIIGWSNVIRFRLASKFNKWVTFIPGTVTDAHIKNHVNLSKNTIEELCINRENDIYSDEVNSWINFINYSFQNCLVINWTPFINNIKLNARLVTDIETIKMETNGEIDDRHFSEMGHKKLSNIFHKTIKKNII